jgi:hypothetical protein
MCGASKQEEQITDAQQQMYQTLNSNYTTAFGEDQAITGALTAAFTPILNAGPSQTGMSPSQYNAMETENTESTAQNYAQAQKATAQTLAAQGGGNTLLPSSTTANVEAANANAAAQERSQGDLNITNEDYQLGRQNWTTAADALGNLSNTLNPNAYASSSTSGGTAAANSANQVAQQSNSVWNAAIGALGSLGGAALGSGLFSSGGSSLPSGMGGTPNPTIDAYNSLASLPAPTMYNPANFGVTTPPSVGY